MTDQPIARIEGLKVSFGDTVAIADLGFEVAAGECLCIVGESGAGKSAAALALMGLIARDGGSIEAGRIMLTARGGGSLDLLAAGEARMRCIRGRDIAMIFQEPMTALNPVLTLGRQVTEGLRRHEGLGASAARARALDLFRQVRLPDPSACLEYYPHELSGGMRQRAMIAMALACRPRLLVADEPTTALDVTTQAEILALLDRLRRETGTAIVFITHDMAVVARIADRVVVMAHGRKVEEGPARRVFASPRAAETRALLDAAPRLGSGRSALPRDIGHDAAEPGRAAPVLEVARLSVRYPARGRNTRPRAPTPCVVRDVSFAIARGRTLALVGESGCGKSSTGRAILRLGPVSGGRVALCGQDMLSLSGAALRRARMRAQMVFQDPHGSLDPRMTLAAQVEEPLRNIGVGRAERAERAAALFDRVALPRGLMRRYAHELSGGQRQRVAIARALAPDPALIVADEAVSALDATVQARVLELLEELQAERGLSYLFISHDMGVVERISHEIAVMHRGRIVERGPRDAVLGSPRHPYTQALLRAVPVPDPDAPAPQWPDRPFGAHPPGRTGDGRPRSGVYHEAAPGHFVLVDESGY